MTTCAIITTLWLRVVATIQAAEKIIIIDTKKKNKNKQRDSVLIFACVWKLCVTIEICALKSCDRFVRCIVSALLINGSALRPPHPIPQSILYCFALFLRFFPAANLTIDDITVSKPPADHAQLRKSEARFFSPGKVWVNGSNKS